MTTKELGRMPASPCEVAYNNDKPALAYMGDGQYMEQGFTKREIFAYGAMKSLVSRYGVETRLDAKMMSEKALMIAGYLLEELAKEE